MYKKIGLKPQTISQHTLNTEHMHNPLQPHLTKLLFFFYYYLVHQHILTIQMNSRKL